jgi:hypothetical protein
MNDFYVVIGLMVVMALMCVGPVLVGTVTGWFRTKRPMHCGDSIICCASPSEFSSFQIHPPQLFCKFQQIHLVVKQGETWREMSVNFSDVMLRRVL